MLEGLVIAIVAGGLVAGLCFPYSGAWTFLRRWTLACLVLVTLFWGGAAFGAVARNAMCQGLWICD